MNITPPNPFNLLDKTTVKIDGKPNPAMSLLWNFTGFTIECALFLIFLRGCRLPKEEMKATPIQGTIISAESLDNKTKFDIDLDGDLNTIERTFYVDGVKFTNTAKPGDKILYNERRNYLAKPMKNMPSNAIKQIGDKKIPTASEEFFGALTEALKEEQKERE